MKECGVLIPEWDLYVLPLSLPTKALEQVYRPQIRKNYYKLASSKQDMDLYQVWLPVQDQTSLQSHGWANNALPPTTKLFLADDW